MVTPFGREYFEVGILVSMKRYCPAMVASSCSEIFGIKLGWIADYDCAAGGSEIINPVPNEKYQGIAKLLPDMVQEYYRLSVGTVRDSLKLIQRNES